MRNSLAFIIINLYINTILTDPYFYAVLQAPSLEQFDALSIVARWCVTLASLPLL
jgi:hypothetical protein